MCTFNEMGVLYKTLDILQYIFKLMIKVEFLKCRLYK
jgi:hypothetical protein